MHCLRFLFAAVVAVNQNIATNTNFLQQEQSKQPESSNQQTLTLQILYCEVPGNKQTTDFVLPGFMSFEVSLSQDDKDGINSPSCLLTN